VKARSANGFCACVGGIPGVGKTTLLSAHVREREPRDRAITGSSVIKELIAPATVGVFDVWPEARRAEVREGAVSKLRERRRETVGRLLVDGHFTLRSRISGSIEGIFTPGDRAFYDALVLVEAPAEHVLAWRLADLRNRDAEPLALVEEHLAAERAEGARLSAAMGVPYLVVTARELTARLDQLSVFLDEHASLER
jgi:adenylate kinase